MQGSGPRAAAAPPGTRATGPKGRNPEAPKLKTDCLLTLHADLDALKRGDDACLTEAFGCIAWFGLGRTSSCRLDG